MPYLARMQRIALILKPVVFALFSLPFLINFGIWHSGDWTGYLALSIALALLVLAGWLAWAAYRRGG